MSTIWSSSWQVSWWPVSMIAVWVLIVAAVAVAVAAAWFAITQGRRRKD